MGKDEKKPAEEILEVDLKKEVGNIEETLDKDVALNKEAIELAAKKINEDRKEVVLEDAKKALYKKEYLIEMQRLHMQKMRRQESASKKFMVAIGDEGLGGELASGKLTPKEFDDKIRKAIETKNEAYRDADRKFSEYHTKMRSKYQGFWIRSWEDPVW